MAIELLSSENSNTSPRISFSHDFSQCEIVPVEQQRLIRSNSTGIDFDFCVRESFESSSADELFSDGKILPTEVKKKKKPLLLLPSPKPQNKSNGNSSNINQKEGSKETKLIRDETEEEEEIKQSANTKSFWGFKRSNSLNCGNSYGRSFCPLPLLSRSNSTGSTPKDNKQQKLAKASSTSYHQKPPLKRNYGSSSNINNNGSVRINPVLNVPSANLFGLASLFSNGGKDKNKKK